jgi:hypothetical protein
MYELARRGHEVTVVSPFPENKAIPNYTEIEVRITMNDLIGDIGKGTGGVYYHCNGGMTK